MPDRDFQDVPSLAPVGEAVGGYLQQAVEGANVIGEDVIDPILRGDRPRSRNLTPEQVRELRAKERKAKAPVAPTLVDVPEAELLNAYGLLSEGNAKTGESAAPDPIAAIAGDMREIRLHEISLDPMAPAIDRMNARMQLANIWGSRTIEADTARATSAQTSTQGKDLAERILTLHTAYRGDLARTTDQLAREGWDRNLITPELITGMENQKGQAESEGDMAKVMALELGIAQLRKEQATTSLRSGTTPGTARPPGIRPLTHSLSPLATPQALAQVTNVRRQLADAQGPTEAPSTLEELGRLTARKVGDVAGVGATVLEAAAQGIGGSQMAQGAATAAGAPWAPAALKQALEVAAAPYAMGRSITQDPTFEASQAAEGPLVDPDGTLNWRAVAVQGGDNAANLGISLGAGVVGSIVATPAVGLIVGAAVGSGLDTGQIMTQVVDDALAKGAPYEAAYAQSMAVGAMYAPIAALLEAVPMEEMLTKSPAGTKIKQFIAERAKKLVLSGVKEGDTEALQEFWQDVSQYAATEDPETFNDWQTRYGTAAAWGTVLGGGAGASVDVAQATATVLTTPGDTRVAPLENIKPIQTTGPRIAVADPVRRSAAIDQFLEVNEAPNAKILSDQDLTDGHRRLQGVADALGLEIVFVDGGKPMPVAPAAASRGGTVVIDATEDTAVSAERLLQHEVMHEFRARMERSGRGEEWGTLLEAVRAASPTTLQLASEQYAADAEAAGIERSEDTLTEEGVATIAQQVVGRVLLGEVPVSELAAIAKEAPGPFVRLVSAAQRVLRRVGAMQGPTLSEATQTRSTIAKLALAMQNVGRMMRETADLIPMSDEVADRSTDGIGLAPDWSEEPGLPMDGPAQTRGNDLELAPDFGNETLYPGYQAPEITGAPGLEPDIQNRQGGIPRPKPATPAPAATRAMPGARGIVIPTAPEEQPIAPQGQPQPFELADDVANRRGLPPGGQVLAGYGGTIPRIANQSAEGGPNRLSSSGSVIPARSSMASETGVPLAGPSSGPPAAQAPPTQDSAAQPPSGATTTRTNDPSYQAGPAITSPRKNFRVGGRDSSTNRRITQQSGEVNVNLERARASLKPVRAQLAELAQTVEGARFEGARVKESDGGASARLLEKIASRPPHTLTDYLGARIAVATPKAAQKIIEAIKKRYRIIDDENFLVAGKGDKGGYRARHIQIVVAPGFSAELQIRPEPIAAIDGPLHHNYEKIRAPGVQPAELSALTADSQAMTDRALAEWVGAQDPADLSKGTKAIRSAEGKLTRSAVEKGIGLEVPADVLKPGTQGKTLRDSVSDMLRRFLVGQNAVAENGTMRPLKPQTRLLTLAMWLDKTGDLKGVELAKLDGNKLRLGDSWRLGGPTRTLRLDVVAEDPQMLVIRAHDMTNAAVLDMPGVSYSFIVPREAIIPATAGTAVRPTTEGVQRIDTVEARPEDANVSTGGKTPLLTRWPSDPDSVAMIEDQMSEDAPAPEDLGGDDIPFALRNTTGQGGLFGQGQVGSDGGRQGSLFGSLATSTTPSTPAEPMRLPGETDAEYKQRLKLEKKFEPAKRNTSLLFALRPAVDRAMALPTFRDWFGKSKVVDEDGRALPVFHGTRRPDRIGTQFRRSRATSGPMAYFTADSAIASTYAKNKADTSLEMPESFGEWFVTKLPGRRSPVPIDRVWWSLSPQQREQIASTLPHVVMDEDGTYRLGGPDEYGIADQKHWEYTIRREGRGDVIKAAIDIWLNSGAIFGNEQDFVQILRLGGGPQVTLNDPDADHGAVVPVFLSIQNPIDTASIPANVVQALEVASRRQRRRPLEGGADPWDKRTRSASAWIDQFRTDLANGTTFSWTSIPDWVTDTLISQGYDGIRDSGGKMGGPSHVVWIPFQESQVKGVFNKGTFDPIRKNLLLALRSPARTDGFENMIERSMREPRGQRTIGRPDLANPGRTNPQRAVIDAADELRPRPEVEQTRQVLEAADEALTTNYQAARERILRQVGRGELLDSTEVAIAQRLVSDAAQRVLDRGNEADLLEAIRIHDAYRQSGTDAARAFRMRADRLKSPAQRHAEYIGRVMAEPSPAVQGRIDRLRQKIRKPDAEPAQVQEAQQELERLLQKQAAKAGKIREAIARTGIDPRTITDETMADRRTAARIIRAISAAKSSRLDKLSEYYINSILSGPRTHVANIIGNAAYGTFGSFLERGVEAAINNMGGARADAATFGEFRAIARSMTPSFARAAHNAVEAWVTEIPILEDDIRRAGGEAPRGGRLDSGGAAIGGKTGRVVRVPTRALLAADEFFKGLTATQDAYARAYRRAFIQEKLEGDAGWNRVGELVNDLTSEVWAESVRRAEHLAFQDELGPIGQGAMAMRNRVPGAFLLIPFIKTPINIAKAGLLKLTPLAVAKLAYGVGADLANNRPIDRQRVSADVVQSVIGVAAFMLMGALLDYRDEDGLPIITGSRSLDRGARDLQNRIAPPMSIRIGGKWISYSRIEPFATAFATIIDAWQAEAVDDVAVSLQQQIKDKTFLKGISDLMEALDNGDSLQSKGVDFAANLAVGFVPNAIRTSLSSTDPYIRNTRIGAKDSAGKIGQRVLQKAIPGRLIVEPPPVRVDLWGRLLEARQAPTMLGDWLYRMTVPVSLRDAAEQTDPGDQLDLLLTRYNNSVPDEARWFPTAPPPTYTVRKGGTTTVNTMTDEEYQAFLVRSGEIALSSLKRAKLDYQNPDLHDIKIIRRALTNARKIARLRRGWQPEEQ